MWPRPSPASLWATLALITRTSSATAISAGVQINTATSVHATPLTIPASGPASTRGTLTSGIWYDIDVSTPHGGEESSVDFEVTADGASGGMTPIEVYVKDAGLALMGGPQSAPVPLSRPSQKADALAAATVPCLRNATHAIFYVSVPSTYHIGGTSYRLMLKGMTTAIFEVAAKISSAAMTHDQGVTGWVGEQQFAHHFIDVLEKPHDMHGLEFRAETLRGVLGAWSVSAEQAAPPSDSDIGLSAWQGRLGGVPGGQATGSQILPSSTMDLSIGRYYVSVQGVKDYCGEYLITVRNVSKAQVEVLHGSNAVHIQNVRA